MVVPDPQRQDRELDVEGRLSRVESTLEIIKDNHLTHMQQDIDKIDRRLWYVVGGVATTVLLGLVNMIFTT